MKITYAVLTILFSLNLMQASAQKGRTVTEQLLASKKFIFNATRANPISEPSLNRIMGSNALYNMLDLSNERYQLKVINDSIAVDLPFFGRSFNAPMNPNNTGIKFTSKDFAYSTTEKKKNWTITIEPKDVESAQKLIIRVSDSGSATLHVNDYNRQAISFDGYITELQPSKKD